MTFSRRPCISGSNDWNSVSARFGPPGWALHQARSRLGVTGGDSVLRCPRDRLGVIDRPLHVNVWFALSLTAGKDTLTVAPPRCVGGATLDELAPAGLVLGGVHHLPRLPRAGRGRSGVSLRERDLRSTARRAVLTRGGRGLSGLDSHLCSSFPKCDLWATSPNARIRERTPVGSSTRH